MLIDTQSCSTTWMDYPDNFSLAIIIYFVGCEHNCTNCHNIALQKYESSSKKLLINDKELYYYIKTLSDIHRTNKIVFSGGDPLFKDNLKGVKELLFNNKEFNVCIYTGYSIDYIKDNEVKGFKFIKSGLYNENKKQNSKKTENALYLASTNQELYDENYNLISKNGIYYFKGV